MLCPPYVYGFSLDMKEWCKFFIDSLQDIEWAASAMDKLILPDAQRRLIRSLVTSHRFPEQARDEAYLKGKGLIVLLHGSPGSGKTQEAPSQNLDRGTWKLGRTYFSRVETSPSLCVHLACHCSH